MMERRKEDEDLGRVRRGGYSAGFRKLIMNGNKKNVKMAFFAFVFFAPLRHFFASLREIPPSASSHEIPPSVSLVNPF
jgi:hypothetical protein